MRVGVIQSSFIPWRGYFDFIASTDVFVFLDDIQYSKNGWRNRNRIKTPRGTQWLTVPIKQKTLSQLICETQIDNTTNWQKKHQGAWQANYAKSPYFADAMKLLEILQDMHDKTISFINIELIKRICQYLGITTRLLQSSDLALSGSKTERLIDLLEKLDASVYLSGPSADTYLNKTTFFEHSIQLEYKSYDYAPYPQLWGGFDGAVTVLDLIANCGPDARKHICSRSPDTIIVAPTGRTFT